VTIAVLPDTSTPFKTSSPVELQPNLRAIVRAETGDASVLRVQHEFRCHAVHPLASIKLVSKVPSTAHEQSSAIRPVSL
jgi:hypothetical protein